MEQWSKLQPKQINVPEYLYITLHSWFVVYYSHAFYEYLLNDLEGYTSEAHISHVSPHSDFLHLGAFSIDIFSNCTSRMNFFKPDGNMRHHRGWSLSL